MYKIKYFNNGKTFIASCNDINIYNEACNLFVKVYDDEGDIIEDEILSEEIENELLEKLYEEKYEKEVSF